MNYWLMKTEPSTFGVDDLAAKPKKTAMWDGVRNYQARNMLRDDFRKGDLAFIYHSSTEETGIAGVMQVVRAAYPDPTQFDRKSKYYDNGSSRDEPRWFGVDIAADKAFKTPVTLKTIKETPELAGMMLVKKGARLSIQPVTDAQWRSILAMGGIK